LLKPRRELLANGRREPIGKRALDILSVLAEAGGEIVTKDELLEAVWPGVIVEENALQVHVVALRKALGPDADRLKTIRGVGYQLWLDPTADAASRPVPAAEPRESSGAGPTIVVLPFDNMSVDQEQAYFADGISEDIITDLAKVSALQVIARNTAFSLRHSPLSVAEVGQKLQASHVLEGSVRRAGERLRVTAQLIEAASGNSIWAERYDRKLADIFDIQDELSAAIVTALKVNLLPQEKREIETRGTRNAEAYDYYLRARALRATMDLAQIPLSLQAYRTALEIDPNFALAWAGLASSLFQNRSHFPDSPDITDEEIDHALKRARALAPHSPDVIAGFAQRAAHEKDWNAAADSIERFRACGDDNWSICSHLLLMLGKASEAALQQEKVRKADPLSIGGSWAFQFHLACARRFAEAEAEFQRSKVLTGGMLAMRWEAIKRRVGMGQLHAARSEFVLTSKEGVELLPFARRLAEVFDDRAAAGEVLREAYADPAAQDQLSRSRIADCAVLIGDTDLAFKAMRGAFVDARGLMMIELWHPIHTTIRKDPRFKQILIDIGLADYWLRTGEWGEFARPVSASDFEVVA
jgi:TolB-like protein